MEQLQTSGWAKRRSSTKKVCKVAECDRFADGSRGWCWAHYMRWHSTGLEPSGPVAPVRQSPEECVVDGCDRSKRIGDHCLVHGRRLQRTGEVGQPKPRVQAANGKGKPRYMSNGYVFLRMPEHPNAYKNGVVQEHTVVMSAKLGRPLMNYENVHHKNGDRTDNRPENLELWSTKQPKGQRVADKLAWAREILDLYGNLPDEFTAI